MSNSINSHNTDNDKKVPIDENYTAQSTNYKAKNSGLFRVPNYIARRNTTTPGSMTTPRTPSTTTPGDMTTPRTPGSTTPGDMTTPRTPGSTTPGDMTTPRTPGSTTPGDMTTPRTPGSTTPNGMTPRTPGTTTPNGMTPRTPGSTTPGDMTTPRTPGTTTPNGMTPRTPDSTTPGDMTTPRTPCTTTPNGMTPRTPGSTTPGDMTTPRTPGTTTPNGMTPRTPGSTTPGDITTPRTPGTTTPGNMSQSVMSWNGSGLYGTMNQYPGMNQNSYLNMRQGNYQNGGYQGMPYIMCPNTPGMPGNMNMPNNPYSVPMGIPLLPIYGYDNSAELDRDIEHMKRLYPRIVRSIEPYVKDECDKLEYDGSIMFDEYPDQVTIDRIVDRIYENTKHLQDESEVESQQYIYPRRNRRDNFRDIITIILLNEFLNRRRRYRSRRRWF